MLKRPHFIIDHLGNLYQLGQPLKLPLEVTNEDGELTVASIDLLISSEQQNIFQVIALPHPGSNLEAANYAMIVDIPEKNVGIVYNIGAISDCKLWLEYQREAETLQDQQDREEMAASLQELRNPTEQEEPASGDEPEPVEPPAVEMVQAQPPTLMSGTGTT